MVEAAMGAHPSPRHVLSPIIVLSHDTILSLVNINATRSFVLSLAAVAARSRLGDITEIFRGF